MTESPDVIQFFEDLERTATLWDWMVRSDGSIRTAPFTWSCGFRCPLTAVANMKSGVQYQPHHWHLANQDEIKLEQKVAEGIVSAADTPYNDITNEKGRELRSRILVALGLTES